MANDLRDSAGRFAPNSHIKRCAKEGCETRVRNSGNFCEEHTDWNEHSHPQSILSDEDLLFIRANIDDMDDSEIAKFLSEQLHHANHSTRQVLLAMRNFRRRKLLKPLPAKLPTATSVSCPTSSRQSRPAPRPPLSPPETP